MLMIQCSLAFMIIVIVVDAISMRGKCVIRGFFLFNHKSDLIMLLPESIPVAIINCEVSLFSSLLLSQLTGTGVKVWDVSANGVCNVGDSSICFISSYLVIMKLGLFISFNYIYI